MKYQAIPIAAFFAATTISSETDAYSTGPGPRGARCGPSRSSFRSRDSFSTSPRSNNPDRYRQRRARIDEAFRELQDEMNDAQRRTKRKTGQFDFMMMDPMSLDFEDVDKEAVKKWVDKAFNLASEFNQDFSRTPKERETNDEFLQKTRDWANRMYSSAATTEEASTTTDEMKDETISSTDDVPPGQDPETTSVAKESEVETPYSENRSDDEMFQVAVDLPGVDREDVDLSLEKDFLTVEAERRSREEDASGPARKYLKKFAVVEDEIEVDKIEASLDNGVLTVSAPKKKKEEEPETKIKIPLA